MNDVELLKQALFEAHTAGDFESAKKIAAKLKNLQGAAPTAITADITEPQFQPSNVNVNDELNLGEKALISFGRSTDKLLKGGQQLFYSATGNDDAAERVRREAEQNNRLWQDNASTGMKVGEVASDIGLAFLPLGGVGKGLQAANVGLKARMAAQGLVGAGQDYLYQKGEGNDDIDLTRTAISGGLSGITEGLSPLLTRTYAKMTASGKRSMENGLEVLRDAGMDPNHYQPEQIMQIGRDATQLSDRVKPSAIVSQTEFDIPMTRGQMTGDRGLLMAEHDLKGVPEGQILKDLENRQYDAVKKTQKRLQSQYSGGSPQLDGIYDSGDVVANAVQGAADDLTKQINQAYQPLNQSRAFLDKSAFDGLSDRALKAVSDANILVDELTPSTKSTLSYLTHFTEQLGDNIKSVSVKKIENVRRIVNNQIDKATGADKKAVIAIKNEFDNWLDESVTEGLMSGDPEVFTQLKQARELRAEFGRRFESDRFISGIVGGEKTANEVVNYMIGAGKIGAKGNAVKAVQSLKNAVGNDHQAIAALKEAVVIKLIEGKGMTAVATDLHHAVSKGTRGHSYMAELFSPRELAELSRLKTAVDHLVPDGQTVNHSNTAYVVLRQLAGRMPGLSLIQSVSKTAGANASSRPLLSSGTSLANKAQSAPIVGAFTSQEGRGTSRPFS